jgi:hypothetical protein
MDHTGICFPTINGDQYYTGGPESFESNVQAANVTLYEFGRYHEQATGYYRYAYTYLFTLSSYADYYCESQDNFDFLKAYYESYYEDIVVRRCVRRF